MLRVQANPGSGAPQINVTSPGIPCFCSCDVHAAHAAQSPHLYPADVIVGCLQGNALLLVVACAPNLAPLPLAVTHVLLHLFLCCLQRLVCFQQLTRSRPGCQRVNLVACRSSEDKQLYTMVRSSLVTTAQPVIWLGDRPTCSLSMVPAWQHYCAHQTAHCCSSAVQ
jgi:hypothetical protein